ncbi:MAG: divergent PAP2 family protein [Clostridia bacterium]|jgi:acid phosphatase family membrane protein YuiD|nr:divergent PAP2 family protein [Clostridia bacterium]
MQEFFANIGANNVLWTALLSWLVAQVSKVALNVWSNGHFDLRRLVGAGGMPSSHTALVIALAIKIGRSMGWHSEYFAIAAVLAGVVMYDAAGVRRATGQQAEVLNKMMSDIYHGEPIKPERLKELIGHSPLEILAGAIIGIICGVLL